MRTILVIDDNKDFRADLREILEFENYVTFEAENGLIGVQMIQKYLPDLVVCDLDMPVMDGIEVLQKVKADPNYAKTPFIVATGQNDDLTLKTVLDLGVEICMIKPLSITKFLETVGYFLNAEAPTLRST